MVGARPVPDNDDATLVGKMVHLLWDMHHRVALEHPKMGELVAFRAPLIEQVSELSVVDEASIEDVIRSKGFALAYVPDAIVTNADPRPGVSTSSSGVGSRAATTGSISRSATPVATLDRSMLVRTATNVAGEVGVRQEGARRRHVRPRRSPRQAAGWLKPGSWAASTARGKQLRSETGAWTTLPVVRASPSDPLRSRAAIEPGLVVKDAPLPGARTRGTTGARS